MLASGAGVDRHVSPRSATISGGTPIAPRSLSNTVSPELPRHRWGQHHACHFAAEMGGPVGGRRRALTGADEPYRGIGAPAGEVHGSADCIGISRSMPLSHQRGAVGRPENSNGKTLTRPQRLRPQQNLPPRRVIAPKLEISTRPSPPTSMTRFAGRFVGPVNNTRSLPPPASGRRRQCSGPMWVRRAEQESAWQAARSAADEAWTPVTPGRGSA